MIEDLQQSFGEEIEHHKASIDSIQEILPASKTRVLIGRFFIGVVGAVIAFGFFEGWIGRIITLSITATVVYSYESTEVANLESSLELHSNDLERLHDNYKTNEAILAQMTAPPVQTE